MKNINQIIASLNVARSNNCSKEKSEEFKSIIKELLPYGKIEEELGIDLITFAKILAKDVYAKCYEQHKVSEYSKMSALTKEELL